MGVIEGGDRPFLLLQDLRILEGSILNLNVEAIRESPLHLGWILKICVSPAFCLL
jgi:hypothetical protein